MTLPKTLKWKFNADLWLKFRWQAHCDFHLVKKIASVLNDPGTRCASIRKTWCADLSANAHCVLKSGLATAFVPVLSVWLKIPQCAAAPAVTNTMSFGKSCGRGMVKTCSKIGSRRQVPKPKKLWSWSRLGKLIPIGVQHGATNVGMFGCRWGRQAQHGLARTLIKAVGNSNERIFSVCRVESAKLATSKTPNLGPQVALCWTQLSWSPSCQPIGHVGLQLGPNRPRWAPNSSHVMHMEVQVTPKVAHLGTFWRQFHTDT